MASIQYNKPMKGGTVMQGPYVFEQFDDFDDAYPLTSNLPLTATSPYNAQASNTGTFTQASPSDAFGVAVLSGAATTNKSGVQIQRDHAGFVFASGGIYETACRIKLSDASNSDFFFGLYNQYGASGPILNGAQSATFLSNLDTTHYTDGVGIYKLFGATGFYGLHQKTSTTTAITPVFGVATTAYTILGIQVLMGQGANGAALVNFFQDGTLLSTLTVSSPTTSNLAPLVGFLSATASGTITCAVDWHYEAGSR
jgi:hypothetical protein